MKRTVLPILAVLVAACGSEQMPIAIATAGPWAMANGAMHKRGVELAVEQINANGGIDGRPVKLIDRDDEASGVKAAKIAAEFVADRSILAVVGHVNSGAMMAAARVYDGNLAAISSTATSPDLTGISSWAFRVIASDSVSAIHMARFAKESGAKQVAILYENNAFGRGLMDPFRKNFGDALVAVDPIPSDPKANFEPYIAFLREKGADLVFVAGSDASGLAILREARRQAFNATFLSGVGWTGVTADPAASEGAFVGVPMAIDDKRQDVQRFVQAFRARYSRDPDAKAALAYDATMLVARAIAEAGPNRHAIREWLHDLNGSRSFAGVTSKTIQFDATGDVANGGFVMTQVRGGALVVQANGSR
ncbi:MAG TPA: ABC transporter substrate-binding protein [Gemmatimonadaceae bacterium]|nr:ABC transporter substrate-binding protein [Gemmatimonadaceae bacterium]